MPKAALKQSSRIPRVPAVVLAAGAVAVLAGCGGPARSRHFNFTYDVTVRELPGDAREVRVWIPVPADTPEQTVRSLDFDSPVDGRLIRDAIYGNWIWHASGEPPTDGILRIRQRAEVLRREQAVEVSREAARKLADRPLWLYLQPDRLVPSDPRFERIAAEQVRNRRDPLAQARALYQYVLDRMAYDKTGDGWGRGDANYACDVGKGNCTDFHSLFIALSRAIDLPARFWIGFPLPEPRGGGEVKGYHCWAEFWVPDIGWVPVDISEADKHPQKADYFFGRLDENRVVYTLGRDLILPGREGAPPLNFFVYPYVEVDGKAWDKVDASFAYQDLSN